MRYVILALMISAALPAQAAYDQTARSGFLTGCNNAGKGQPADVQAKVSTMCDCMMGKIETAMPQDQFVKLAKTEDHGMSQLKPIIMPCVPSMPAQK